MSNKQAFAVAVVLGLLILGGLVLVDRNLQPPVVSSVTGGAWLKRNDGQSDMLRGLRVCIVQKTVAAQTIKSVLDAQVEADRRRADYADGVVADYVKNPETDDHGTYAQEFRDKAASDRKNAESTVSTSAALTGEKDFLDAWNLCNSVVPVHFSILADDRIVAEGKTGIDGKYEVSNVPNGTYYVYAEIETPKLRAEWVVPITLDGKPVKIDLDNDNAVHISNEQ